MKPNSKILTLILGVAVVLTSSLFAQRSDAWVQDNWERVSGNFENGLASRDAGVGSAEFQADANELGHVRHTDHQSATTLQPLSNDLNGMLADSPEVDLNTVPSTAQWTDDIQTQLSNVNWPKVLSSLAIVVGLYLGFVWMMRKANPRMNGGLPSEVFELVGSKRMSAKQTLQLVRLGSKLLLLVHGDEGTHPIAEITDPEEVEYLTSVCQKKPASRRSSHRPVRHRATAATSQDFGSAMERTRREGDSTEAAMDKVIRKLSEMADKASRTDFEA